MKKVIILGAGPCGLAVAWQIKKKCPEWQVCVVDRSLIPGGAGGSFPWRGHQLDFGPHAFHTRGGEAEALVKELFVEEPQELLQGRKTVSIYLRDRFFKYPLQMGEAILKFNPLVSARIIIEFALTSIFHALVSVSLDSFQMWGEKRFGPTLYQLGFGDYSEKVWKTPADRISVKFASEKIQGFSFLNLIKKLFKIGGEVTEPYYQTWLYPRKGSGEMYRRLVQKLEEKGVEVMLGAQVECLHHREGRVHALSLTKGGQQERVEGDLFVSTLALPQMIRLMDPEPEFFIQHSAKKLKAISLILVYLELDQEWVSDYHWFYLLDTAFQFNRVTEQKHLSRDTLKPGKTVLSMELTCRKGDTLWNLTDEELSAMAIKDLNRIKGLSEFHVKHTRVCRVPDVYEIYYRNFDLHADIVLSYLFALQNFYPTGRRGLFLQGDQHQAMSMGLELADLLGVDDVDSDALDRYYKKYLRYFTHENVSG